MWEKLRRFSALERPAQKLFLGAWVMLPVISLSLRLRGFQATRSTLQRTLSNSLPEPDAEFVKGRVTFSAHSVNAADRHGLVHPSCLAKSLALWWLLGCQGITSQLRIGIRKDKEKFEAHAWVERDALALNEPDEHHYHYAAFDKAFASLPQDEA